MYKQFSKSKYSFDLAVPFAARTTLKQHDKKSFVFISINIKEFTELF